MKQSLEKRFIAFFLLEDFIGMRVKEKSLDRIVKSQINQSYQGAINFPAGHHSLPPSKKNKFVKSKKNISKATHLSLLIGFLLNTKSTIT